MMVRIKNKQKTKQNKTFKYINVMTSIAFKFEIRVAILLY